MEKNTIQSILIVSLLLGLLLGQSTALFNEICYKECHNKCLLQSKKTVKACTRDCLKTCNSLTSSDTPQVKNTQYFCELGCVYSLCPNLGTKENPGDGEKSKGCTGYCSKTCAKN